MKECYVLRYHVRNYLDILLIRKPPRVMEHPKLKYLSYMTY